MTEELKINSIELCPWCGSKGEVRVNNNKYSVHCTHTNWCPVLPWTWDYDTEEEAIKAWNTRKGEMHCNMGSIPDTSKAGEQE